MQGACDARPVRTRPKKTFLNPIKRGKGPKKERDDIRLIACMSRSVSGGGPLGKK